MAPLTVPRRALIATAAIGVGLTRAETANAGGALATLEAQHGGRLGVSALDTGSRRQITHHGTDRFPMCSTHKFLTVAAVLESVDRGTETLETRVPYGPADLLTYAPVTRKNVAEGFMTVGTLAAATIEWSDNTAENLLLHRIGGPVGWTRFARSIGDEVSRLDRWEPALNSAIKGDPRDTTTPDAMRQNLDAILLGEVLSGASRARLQHWMLEGTTGDALLRARLPKGWRIGDKSGAGDNATLNDIGVILRPDAAPIVAVVYYTGAKKPLAVRQRVLAEVGEIIAKTFGA